MDKIIIQDLELYGYHGVFPEENFLGQKFLISMELFLDFQQAGKQDDLNLSVSYAEICKFVETEFLNTRFKLIEACAESIAQKILLQYSLIQKIKLEIKKPWAPIGSHLSHVSVKIERGWHKAYLGLGSNMGNKEENLNQAIALLKTETTLVTKASSFIETKPVGYIDQDDFLNCAIEIKTLLSPLELVHFALEAEKKLKRERLIHWGPRTIDIDILLYDTIITENETILIPHPRMTERLFVLVPLSEIAPYAIHPLENKRILALKENLMQQQKG